MKLSLPPFLLAFLTLMLAGCVQPDTASTHSLRVVASFYPLYEIAQRVGGEYVDAVNLVPPGAEPHDYELSPQDIVKLYQAQLILYNGAGMEPWADKILPELQKKGIVIVNESADIGSLAQSNDKEFSGFDPHIWLDPLRYIEEIRLVAKKLAGIDPSHKKEYQRAADVFIQEVREVHTLYDEGFGQCKHHSFVTNHAAFGYLSRRYGLTMIPIAGLSPDAEPSPRQLADSITNIKKEGVHYILVETLVSSKVAEALAHEAGAQILELNPLEGLTPKEKAEGENYVSIMKENFTHLHTALECQ